MTTIDRFGREVDEHGLPTEAEQRKEIHQWRTWFEEAGYSVCQMWVGDETGGTGLMGYEWQVWTADGVTPVATFDSDGTGASWHGPDELWSQVVEPHCEMIDKAEWLAAYPMVNGETIN